MKLVIYMTTIVLRALSNARQLHPCYRVSRIELPEAKATISSSFLDLDSSLLVGEVVWFDFMWLADALAMSQFIRI